MNNKAPKTIALVTHEFGLMRNSGGIAGYLYMFTKKYLEYDSEVDIYVITCSYHKKTDLLDNSRVHIYPLKTKKLSERGLEVLEILKTIAPDIVEVSDYMGLCLESMIYKLIVGKPLENTIFMQYCHTATREICEWGGYSDIINAPPSLKVPMNREFAQTVVSDIVMAPSQFLRSYVTKIYGIHIPLLVPYACDVTPVDKHEFRNKIKDYYEFNANDERFVISYITRFEARKNQKLLVSAFLRFLKEQNPNALLLLVGNSVSNVVTKENVMLEIYRSIPKEYKSNIRFFEFATRDEKEKFFYMSDLTVMTSPYENFPLAMIESVKYGVPVMTSVHCGCCDYMGKYKKQMSFDPFCEEDLYEKISNFYNMGKDWRDSVILEEQNELEKLCSLENSLEKKINLYRLAVNEKDIPFLNYDVFVYNRSCHVNIASNSNIIISQTKNNDFSDLENVLKKICHMPGQYAVSLGIDSLHTNCQSAWNAGFSMLFTHVDSFNGELSDLMNKLFSERQTAHFSIPYKIYNR